MTPACTPGLAQKPSLPALQRSPRSSPSAPRTGDDGPHHPPCPLLEDTAPLKLSPPVPPPPQSGLPIFLHTAVLSYKKQTSSHPFFPHLPCNLQPISLLFSSRVWTPHPSSCHPLISWVSRGTGPTRLTSGPPVPLMPTLTLPGAAPELLECGVEGPHLE